MQWPFVQMAYKSVYLHKFDIIWKLVGSFGTVFLCALLLPPTSLSSSSCQYSSVNQMKNPEDWFISMFCYFVLLPHTSSTLSPLQLILSSITLAPIFTFTLPPLQLTSFSIISRMFSHTPHPSTDCPYWPHEPLSSSLTVNKFHKNMLHTCEIRRKETRVNDNTYCSLIY